MTFVGPQLPRPNPYGLLLLVCNVPDFTRVGLVPTLDAFRSQTTALNYTGDRTNALTAVRVTNPVPTLYIN